MATIRKRGNSYQIRVSCGYDAKGNQILKTMTYKPPAGMTAKKALKEAERQAALFEERCINGTVLDGNMKLSDFADKWFEDYAEKQLKAKTVALYKELMKRITPALGHIRIDRLQPLHLIEFYNNLAEDGMKINTKYKPVVDFKQHLKNIHMTQRELAELAGVSIKVVESCVKGVNISRVSAEKITSALHDMSLFEPVEANTSLSSKTIQHHHRLLSCMLNTAVEWQMIVSNPCDRVKAPKATRKEADYLDDKQAIELINCLNSAPLKYKAMIMLFIYSGMRRGELCGLNWTDIDFKNNLININKSSLYLPDRGIYEDTTKNKSSERVIRIPADVISLLAEYKREQLQLQLLMGDQWKGSGKVFTTQDGKPIHPDTVTGWFHKFTVANNLPDIHIHSLRHTNATLLIAGGTDLRTVAKRLGHANLSTTSNIYAHAIRIADEIASEKLSDILNPAEKIKQA